MFGGKKKINEKTIRGGGFFFGGNIFVWGEGWDHVTSGPKRGLKKLHLMAQTHIQTDRHGDSMTESAQWGHKGSP